MIVKDLGLVEYQPAWQLMQDFTANRHGNTEDELWLLEHCPVFTQGANGQDEHILVAGDIPVVNTDRGGQITYHGPGQLVAYTLFDLKRQGMGIREVVSRLENSVITLLDDMGIKAKSRRDAPGVYVDDRKIAALGLRVKRGACYHGLSLNVDMDLTPFSYINPCGYRKMPVIDIKTLGYDVSMEQAKQQLVSALDSQIQQGKK